MMYENNNNNKKSNILWVCFFTKKKINTKKTSYCNFFAFFIMQKTSLFVFNRYARHSSRRDRSYSGMHHLPCTLNRWLNSHRNLRHKSY